MTSMEKIINNRRVKGKIGSGAKKGPRANGGPMNASLCSQDAMAVSENCSESALSLSLAIRFSSESIMMSLICFFERM